MARNPHGPNHHPRQRDRLQANREYRGGKLIKIFRNVEDDAASLVGGSLVELAASGDIPPIRTTTKLSAFLLDPRLLNAQMGQGLLAGFEVGKLVARLAQRGTVLEEGYDVAIGRVRLLPEKRRTLMLSLESERLRKEREGVHSILIGMGLKGFNNLGRRSDGARTPTDIVLGNLEQPLSRASEGHVIDAVQAGLEVNFSATGNQIALGGIQIVNIRPS